LTMIINRINSKQPWLISGIHSLYQYNFICVYSFFLLSSHNTMKTLPSLLLILSPLLFHIPSSALLTKSFERKMVEISDDFYINKYETTNAEYRAFLKWAKETGQEETLKISEVNNKGWEGLNLLSPNNKYYFEHQDFDQYPVVNISYDGAVKFCEWLSLEYNNSKKRKFQKVKFRLPTKKEWISILDSLGVAHTLEVQKEIT